MATGDKLATITMTFDVVKAEQRGGLMANPKFDSIKGATSDLEVLTQQGVLPNDIEDAVYQAIVDAVSTRPNRKK